MSRTKPRERGSTQDAAAILGLCDRTIRDMASRGELPGAAKPRGTWTFNLDSLRICKPKVGSSILSTGTVKSLYFAGFLRVPASGKDGMDGERMRFSQPQNQDHLFPTRSVLQC